MRNTTCSMAPRSDPAGTVVAALDTVEDDPHADANTPAPAASAPPKKIRRSNDTDPESLCERFPMAAPSESRHGARAFAESERDRKMNAAQPLGPDQEVSLICRHQSRPAASFPPPGTAGRLTALTTGRVES